MDYNQELVEYIKTAYATIYKINVQNVIDEIQKLSPYSEKITPYIRNVEELNKYLELSLKEGFITRPTLLIDIDINYRVNGGLTNLEKMSKGNPPYDYKTGKVIELHHIGQHYDSPFAELPQLIHGGTGVFSIFHNLQIESWRLNKDCVLKTQNEISRYWIKRGEQLHEISTQRD